MEKLHTDALAQKYGPIRAVVLRHDSDEGVRESKLVDDKGVMRTYALTLISYDKTKEEITKIDNEIKQGGLIGATFRKYSYATKRNVVDVFDVYIPSWMQKDFEVGAKKAKARLVEFYARENNSEPVSYAIILEIISPDFEDPYGETDKDVINPPIAALEKAGIPMDEIWNSLGGIIKNNMQRDTYEKARKFGRPLLKSLNERIANYFKPSLSVH